MLHRATVLLGLGESVVLDASWRSAEKRAAAREVTVATSSDLVELCCDAPPDVALHRIEERRRAGNLGSDADECVARWMSGASDRWPQARRLDTTGPLDATVEEAVTAIRPVRVVARSARRPILEPD
jgi:hypothetical protein